MWALDDGRPQMSASSPRGGIPASPRATLFRGPASAAQQVPWVPPPEQQAFGTNMVGLAVTDKRRKPHYVPPLAPAFQRTASIPLPTHYAPDRIFDDGIFLPRGDVGAQQYGRPEAHFTSLGRPTSKLDGNEWTGSPRARQANEIGTSPRSSVRAWMSPGSQHIVYQGDDRGDHLRSQMRFLANYTNTVARNA